MCVQSTAFQNDQRNSFLLNGNRHQRDRFSGSLGIPDVTTHVGSVVHAFELMARNPTESPTDTIAHQSYDLLLSPAEQPYEIQTISNVVESNPNHRTDDIDENAGATAKRKHIYRNTDASNSNLIMPTVQKSSHQMIKRQQMQQRFIDIPTPPPPPILTQNLQSLSPLSQNIDDEFSSFELKSAAPMPTTKLHASQHSGNFGNTSFVHYNNNHMLPHANAIDNTAVDDGSEMSKQFIPASQIIRMNENLQQSKQRSIAVSGSSTSKRVTGITRGKTTDDSYDSSSRNVISANDYRRKLFGSQPNIIDSKVYNAPATILIKPNSSSVETNYANIDFRENFDQPLQQHTKRIYLQNHQHRQHQKNDSNYYHQNNDYSRNHSTTGRMHEHSASDAFFVQNSNGLGNRFLNRINTINHNNNNHKNVNNNHHRNTNLIESNDNWRYSNDDDQKFLRGTTVSQSFIKNMNNTKVQMPLKQFARSSSNTSNGFKRIETSKPIQSTKPTKNRAISTPRTYYKPQKYILNDNDEDDDYFEDELRARYTEHNSNATLASTKPLAKNAKSTKSSTDFGFKQPKSHLK